MKACLYTGRVNHSRFRPRTHHFAYGISMVMVDISSIGQGHHLLAMPGWLRLLLPLRPLDHLKDYRTDPGVPLSTLLSDLVRERAGFELEDGGEINLLTGLGFLGHRFNPVSFYYCYGRSGGLQCLVAEVTNTPWHEQFYYVLDTRDQQSLSELRFDCQKDFHVSPFMPMDTGYRWQISRPDEQLTVAIAVIDQNGLLFNASLEMSRKALTISGLMIALSRQPLMSLSISLRIYWQALRLWLKSIPFFNHPRYSSGDK